jgi:thiosulfate reductase cytochrome b subunit
MIASLNVWVDAIAVIMVTVAALFWAFEILGNIVTGRIRKEYRYHAEAEEKVKVFPRVVHIVHVLSMIALGISGIYLRYPFFADGRELMKQIHFVAMYVVPVVFIVRIVYAKMRDSEKFKITRADLKNIPSVILYYMFIKRSYEHLSKYNVMQKMTYSILFPALLVIQIYTGFALMWPNILLIVFKGLAGGTAAAASWARLTHFIACMVLVMLTLIHICLSFVEDLPGLLVFFGLRRQRDQEDYYYEDEEYYDEGYPEEKAESE